MNAARPPVWVVLKAHLAASPRKTGVLVFLFVVMVVIYARWILKATGPNEAAAAVAPAVSPGAAERAASPAPARFRLARPLVRELTRDPFAVRLDRFAADPDALVEPAAEAGTPDAPPAPACAEFVLQSTITGPMPMAWINGRCVQPGDEIDGFQLERVEAARAVLSKEGAVRVLTME